MTLFIPEISATEISALSRYVHPSDQQLKRLKARISSSQATFRLRSCDLYTLKTTIESFSVSDKLCCPYILRGVFKFIV